MVWWTPRCTDLVAFTNLVFIIFVSILFGYHKDYTKGIDKKEIQKKIDITYGAAIVFVIINSYIWYYLNKK